MTHEHPDPEQPEEEEDQDISDEELAEMAANLQANLQQEIAESQRNRRKAAILLTVGCAIQASIGFFPDHFRLWTLPIAFTAIIILFRGFFTRDRRSPETSLIVLLDLNATFWAAFVVWRIQLHFSANPAATLDRYKGALLFWLLTLFMFAPLQAIAFWVGIGKYSSQRAMAGVGIILLIVQFLTTWKVACHLSGMK